MMNLQFFGNQFYWIVRFLLLGLVCVFAVWTNANEYSKISRTQEYVNRVEIFPTESTDPALVSLVGNKIQSVEESADGRLVIAGQSGVVSLDMATSNVVSSSQFKHPFDEVQLISARNSLWIHGRIDRTTNLPGQPVEEDHELLRVGSTSPRISFECISVGVAKYVGYQVVDFEGDDLPSLVTLCWDGKNSHYANVVDLNVGSKQEIKVPFAADGALVGNLGMGKQSLVLLTTTPLAVYACREGASISRCPDTQSITGITFVIEENNESELVGRIADSIPNAESFEYHNVAQFLYSRTYLNGELLLNNAIFSGRLFLQWTVDGKIRNWWSFKRNEKVREILEWIDMSQSPSNSNGVLAIAVTRIWGDWCRWTECSYRIIQLRNDGSYRVMDSTPFKIDNIMVTSDYDLIASWNGKVFRYNLNSVEQIIPWQESRPSKKQALWILDHI